MKGFTLTGLLVALISILSLSGCEVVGGIFKAGVWVGVFMVVAVIGLIIYLFSRFSGGSGNTK